MSNNKDETQEETRTDRRIKRDQEKLEKIIVARNRSNVILIADSKGRELQKQRESHTHIQIQYHPGAKLRNTYLDSAIKCHLNNRMIHHPIVLIWLGNWELTTRSSSGFVLQPNVESYVHSLISSYQIYKTELRAINPRATIIFLECPYFELQTFNLKKGHRSSNISKL